MFVAISMLGTCVLHPIPVSIYICVVRWCMALFCRFFSYDFSSICVVLWCRCLFVVFNEINKKMFFHEFKSIDLIWRNWCWVLSFVLVFAHIHFHSIFLSRIINSLNWVLESRYLIGFAVLLNACQHNVCFCDNNIFNRLCLHDLISIITKYLQHATTNLSAVKSVHYFLIGFFFVFNAQFLWFWITLNLKSKISLLTSFIFISSGFDKLKKSFEFKFFNQ